LNWGVTFIILELFLWNYSWELSYFHHFEITDLSGNICWNRGVTIVE
jgi:hypothetical protein